MTSARLFRYFSNAYLRLPRTTCLKIRSTTPVSIEMFNFIGNIVSWWPKIGFLINPVNDIFIRLIMRVFKCEKRSWIEETRLTPFTKSKGFFSLSNRSISLIVS